MTTDQTTNPESARALLYRHGLPEDVIDGALALHAQELAALQRLRMDELDLTGQKARLVGRIVDLIDPTRTAPAAVPVPPPADRTALRDRIAEALMRWAEGNNAPQYASMRRPETVRQNAYGRADAVLAVLPEPTDQAASELASLAVNAGRALRDEKRHYEIACEENARLRAEIERMRERHTAGLRRADELNNELMEEVQRYAAGEERPVLWSVYNEMHKRALTAEYEVERLRRMAAEEQPTAHSCRNCDGIDPDTCLNNPDRPKPPPMDPVHILGIDAETDRPAVGEQPDTQTREA